MVIPEGYKKTEIGIIPEDWDVVKICDSCDLIGGGTPSKSQSDWWKGTFPWISSSDLFFNSIHKIQITRYITKEAVINSATKKCPKYSVLVVTRVGVGKVACAPCDICTSQDFTNLIPHKHDPLYLSYYMAKEMKGKTDSIQGTSIKGITSKEISETIICLPDRNEQMRIATALNDIDSLIDNLEKLVEKKKNIKQGAMQELLTGKRRLPGFDGEWIESTIFDASCLVLNGDRSERYPSKDEFISFGIPFINAGHLQNGKVNFHNMDYISESHYISLSGAKLKPGDILLCLRGSLGKYAFVDFSKGAPASSLCVIRCSEVLKNRLIYYIIGSQVFRDLINKANSGSSQPNLSADTVSKFKISFPKDIKEQIAIAELLSDMDNEIEELEKKLAKYRNLKQGMMSELLSGHIRLIEKEDA